MRRRKVADGYEWKENRKTERIEKHGCALMLFTLAFLQEVGGDGLVALKTTIGRVFKPR